MPEEIDVQQSANWGFLIPVFETWNDVTPEDVSTLNIWYVKKTKRNMLKNTQSHGYWLTQLNKICKFLENKIFHNYNKCNSVK